MVAPLLLWGGGAVALYLVSRAGSTPAAVPATPAGSPLGGAIAATLTGAGNVRAGMEDFLAARLDDVRANNAMDGSNDVRQTGYDIANGATWNSMHGVANFLDKYTQPLMDKKRSGEGVTLQDVANATADAARAEANPATSDLNPLNWRF